jgi:hypothetical protein
MFLSRTQTAIRVLNIVVVVMIFAALLSILPDSTPMEGKSEKTGKGRVSTEDLLLPESANQSDATFVQDAAWTFCADQDTSRHKRACICLGTARFGVPGSWSFKNAHGEVPCNRKTFGREGKADTDFVPEYQTPNPECHCKWNATESFWKNKDIPHGVQGVGAFSATQQTPMSFRIYLKSFNGSRLFSDALLNNSRPLFFWVCVSSKKERVIPDIFNEGSGILHVTYQLQHSGLYFLRIIMVDMQKPRMERDSTVFISRLRVNSKPESVVFEKPSSRLCAARDLGWMTGRWHRALPRGPWTYHFPHCSLRELRRPPAETWVLVLGKSTDRGLFLSMVDGALSKEKKRNFASSTLQKCWGWIDVQIGRARFSYQDFRVDMSSNERIEQGVVCHNERMFTNAYSDRITRRNASAFLSDFIFGKRALSYPTVVYSSMSILGITGSAEWENTTIVQNRMQSLSVLLPSWWKGKWVMNAFGGTLMVHSKNAFDLISQTVLSQKKRGQNREGFRRVVEAAREIDKRLLIISTFDVMWSKLDGEEFSTFGSTLHHHTIGMPCLSERQAAHGQICSDVIQLLQTFIFHVARSFPPPPLLERPKTNENNLTLCEDCPASLFPFHINPHPNPLCQSLTFLPEDTKTRSVWQNGYTPCPSTCLAKKATKNLSTGSGTVEERRC